jgi:hypothetical protein
LLGAVFPQRERLFEPFRDFVEELLRAFVGGFRRAGAFLGMGFFFVVFLIALRAAVAEADFFPGLVFPRLDAEAAFVFEARFFPPRAFFVLPARVSTKAVTALDATFIAASTFALAASAIASCADVLNPAFSFSMIASFPDSSRNRHTQRGQCSHQQKLCRICALAYPPATKRGGRAIILARRTVLRRVPGGGITGVVPGFGQGIRSSCSQSRVRWQNS